MVHAHTSTAITTPITAHIILGILSMFDDPAARPAQAIRGTRTPEGFSRGPHML
jgi:hypothetical protein